MYPVPSKCSLRKCLIWFRMIILFKAFKGEGGAILKLQRLGIMSRELQWKWESDSHSDDPFSVICVGRRSGVRWNEVCPSSFLLLFYSFLFHSSYFHLFDFVISIIFCSVFYYVYLFIPCFPVSSLTSILFFTFLSLIP